MHVQDEHPTGTVCNTRARRRISLTISSSAVGPNLPPGQQGPGGEGGGFDPPWFARPHRAVRPSCFESHEHAPIVNDKVHIKMDVRHKPASANSRIERKQKTLRKVIHRTRLRTRSVTVEARPHMVPYHKRMHVEFLVS